MHQKRLLKNILKIKVNFSSTSPKGKGFPKLMYNYEANNFLGICRDLSRIYEFTIDCPYYLDGLLKNSIHI